MTQEGFFWQQKAQSLVRAAQNPAWSPLMSRLVLAFDAVLCMAILLTVNCLPVQVLYYV